MTEPIKKLGKLSLAILENFVATALGEGFVDELRGETNKAIAIASAVENTEARFIGKFHDKDLSKALFVDLKQKDRPILKDVVGKFYEHPTDTGLPTALQKIFFGEFKKIAKDTVKQAVGFYIEILTEELALVDETFRENVRALADLRGEKSQQEMVEILRRVEILLSQKETTKIESTVFRSLHQLPPPPADFTGREVQITELLKGFDSHKGATISGWTGMGGIGKTALGLVVANQLKEKYPDAQIFLDLKGISPTPLSATGIMRHVILSFEPTIDLRALDDANMSAKYYSILHEKKVLLFLDNARSAEQIAPLLPPETCAMLVTSRWMFAVPGLQFHPVRIMEENEANHFLLLICSRIREMATEISKACGYLPLALRIAGSFLNEYVDWAPSDYVNELRERKLNSLKLEDNPELNVEACLKLSYLQLSDKDQFYWRSLGVFPSSFTREICEAILDIDNKAAHEMLSRFCRMSLLDYYSESLSYRLHDLLHEYAGKLVSSSESTNLSVKLMKQIQTNPSSLLSFSEDFHPDNFDPESHLVFGVDLIKTDHHKAIAYYSELLEFLLVAPWIPGDSRMARLAEISCNLLTLAFEKAGARDKALYYKKQAMFFSNMRRPKVE